MDKNKKGPIGQTAQQYSESTTIHGIQYIFENDKFMFDRILWILIVICGIFFAVYLSVLAHVEWKNNPVLTTVATTGFPIEKIDFPAITICAQGMSREILDAAVVQQFKKYLAKQDKVFEQLTKNELKEESQNFLQQYYPGAKSPPNKMVELMSSPAPSKSLDNSVLVNPEEEKTCSVSRRKRSTLAEYQHIVCPDQTWHRNLYGDCIKYVPEDLDFEQADVRCKQLDTNSQLLILREGVRRIRMWKDISDNKFSGFAMSINFWLKARSKKDANQYKWVDDNKPDDTTDVFYLGDFFDDAVTNGAQDWFAQYDCLSVKAKQTEENHYETFITDCGQIRKFFCAILNPDYPNTGNVVSSDPAIPSLPEFPCAKSSRKRRNANDNVNNTAANDNNNAANDNNNAANGNDNAANGNNNEANGNDNAANGNGNCNTNDNSNQKLSSSIEKLNLLLDPSKENERESKKNESKQDYKDRFGSMDLIQTYSSLFEILWYSQMPCFDVKNVTSDTADQMSIIKRCSWKGKDVACPAIFKTLPTDRGMCCSFNMEKAEELFEKSKYADMVQTMQDQDMGNSFYETELPDWYKDKEPKPQPGQMKGLRLVLDAHSDQISPGTVFDDFKGFVTVVGDKSSFPLTKRNSFLLKPGRENYVSISAVNVISDKTIRSIDPEKRNCYFYDEHPLELHKNYSQANCILECSTKYAREKMTSNCTPWYFPVTDDSAKMCDPWETNEFLQIMDLMPDGNCNTCLPDCSTTIYDQEVSSAPFKTCDHTNLESSNMCQLTALSSNENINPPPFASSILSQFKDESQDVPKFVTDLNMFSNKRYHIKESKISNVVFKYKVKDKPTYNAFEEDIAIVNFFFDKPSILQFTKQESMTIVDYISQLGGLLGLFIGFSFISAFEIIYWVTIRLCKNLREHDRKETEEADEKSVSTIITKSWIRVESASNYIEPSKEMDE